MLDNVTDAFAAAQQWLFEAAVQPVAFAVGAGNLLEDGFAATGWLLAGLVQIAVMLLVIGPLQRLWPVERVSDRHAIAIDVVYTLIHRLGLFKLVMFFSVELWLTEGIGWLRAHGLPTLQVDQLWPGVTDVAWVSFLIYLVLFDAIGYLIHRAQHRWHWWWQLHAVHHSQRQMTMWSDNRNHLLDSVITDVIFVVVAIVIGVAPAQFVALVAVTQLLESLHHANLRWSWGRIGNRLLVSPSFHRRHHAIALGHEPGTSAYSPYGGNYGVLFPWWDMLLGSADWRPGIDATGIDDQVLRGRDYGRGFWAQQWLGLKRLAGLDRRPADAAEKL
ncbi:sterol desaturase family protein [Ottowia sp. SB7-C50]|uniref:sterol desaturase family protein n=1 Tax=Ottowia sp. SB7-C50 TaxID=3081231 RepID=UPI002954E61C|nr:sterol desaturase family protein [Ottowia sp. SB7-C50]WOP14243.1 sterol desaturase family protein [Ottowia sp. SB7-C50]